MTLALAGYLTRWNKPVDFDGRRVMLLPTAFDRTLKSGAVVDLLFDHNESDRIGSTADNLELFSNNHGLAFRYRITDTESDRRVKSVADSKSNTCASVGFDWKGATTTSRIVDGVETVCIIDATLFEGSYVLGFHTGRMEDAFATLMDLDYNESLKDNCSGGRFLCEGTAVGVIRALRDLADKPRRDAQQRWLASLPKNHDWL